MENVIARPAPLSKKRVYAGVIISALLTAFMVWDAAMKIFLHPLAVQGTAKAGYAEHLVRPLGFVALACTLLFAVPRTRFVGALLLTAYYGGAVATHLRLEQPFVFPIVFGVLVWISVYLRDRRLHALIA